MPGMREISPVWVSEGELEHVNRGNLPESGIFTLLGRHGVSPTTAPHGTLGGIITHRDSRPTGHALDRQLWTGPDCEHDCLIHVPNRHSRAARVCRIVRAMMMSGGCRIRRGGGRAVRSRPSTPAPGPGSSSTMPPGLGTTTSCGPNGCWYMLWKAQLPSPYYGLPAASFPPVGPSLAAGLPAGCRP